jgi:pimeloyl-ACP methyl ester carboxylesterase
LRPKATLGYGPAPVPINRGIMHLVEFGGSGPPLHFAHANGYPPGSYRRMLEPLTAAHRVEAMAFRPLWEPFAERSDIRGWDLLAKDLIELIERRYDRPVRAVGHSMGGVATMFAAVARPELFDCVMLLDPVFLPLRHVLAMRLTPRSRRRWLPLIRKAEDRPHHFADRQAAFDFHRRARAFARLSDEALWDYIRAGTRETGDGVELSYPGAWEAEVYATVPHVWRRLSRCRVPMMGLRGSESDTVSDAAWQRWQRLQPTGEFVQVEDSGHLVPLERPRETALAVARFLGRTR